MKNPILTTSHGSGLARLLTQIGYRIALVAIPLLTLCSAQLAVALTTIQVTTTQQGVSDAIHCSLQEAIYAAEFARNTALNLMDPDRFYTTGCVLQGSTPPYEIVLQKAVYSFGGTLTYTVTVTNLGPFPASAVTLADPVPAQAIFLSMNSGGASCTAPPPAMVGTVMCNFGTLASGASATMSFTVRDSIPPVPASITNNAVVSSPNFDPNPANNTATVRTLVFGNKRL